MFHGGSRDVLRARVELDSAVNRLGNQAGSVHECEGIFELRCGTSEGLFFEEELGTVSSADVSSVKLIVGAHGCPLGF